MLAAPDWAAAKGLAEAAIAQAAAILDFQGLEPAAGFAAVRAAVADRLRDNESAAPLEGLLGAQLDSAVGQASFARVKAALLDIYAAHSLLPAEAPEQREKALLSLRTLHALERLAADHSLLAKPDLLARLLRARVVLPAAFLRKQTSTQPTSAPAPQDLPAGPTPSSGRPVLPAALFYTQANFARLKTLALVEDELRAARRQNREQLTLADGQPAAALAPSQWSGPAASASQAGSPASGSGSAGRRVVSTSSTAQPASILLSQVASSLSEPTRAFLSEAKLPVDRVDIDDALDILAGRIAELRSIFFQGVPTSTMVQVDRLVAHPEIDQQLPPLSDGPVQAPAPAPVGTSSVPRVGSVRPLGVGDLLLVEQTLQRYEACEISYIENVLRSESLTRTFRTLNRSEQTVFSSTTETTETEHDLQTADRCELSSETQKTIAQDQSTQTGVTVSGGYGPVQIGAQADFATDTSTSESQSSALTYAQDVTDRSLSRVTSQVREGQTTRIIQETEETNSHGFDNTDGQTNIAGIYQWLGQALLRPDLQLRPADDVRVPRPRAGRLLPLQPRRDPARRPDAERATGARRPAALRPEGGQLPGLRHSLPGLRRRPTAGRDDHGQHRLRPKWRPRTEHGHHQVGRFADSRRVRSQGRSVQLGTHLRRRRLAVLPRRVHRNPPPLAGGKPERGHVDGG